MSSNPTAEDFAEWRKSPVGEWFFDHFLTAVDAKHESNWAELYQAKGATGDDLKRSQNELHIGAGVVRQVREATHEGIVQDLENFSE